MSYIVDFKTSGGVYLDHLFQVTSYQQAILEMLGIKAKRGILHLNPKTKKGWKFHDDNEFKIKQDGTKPTKYTPITITDFLLVLKMYKMLKGGIIPDPKLVDSYPIEVKLYE